MIRYLRVTCQRVPCLARRTFRKKKTRILQSPVAELQLQSAKGHPTTEQYNVDNPLWAGTMGQHPCNGAAAVSTPKQGVKLQSESIVLNVESLRSHIVCKVTKAKEVYERN